MCCRPLVVHDNKKDIHEYMRCQVQIIFSSEGGESHSKQDCMIQVQSYSVFSWKIKWWYERPFKACSQEFADCLVWSDHDPDIRKRLPSSKVLGNSFRTRLCYIWVQNYNLGWYEPTSIGWYEGVHSKHVLRVCRLGRSGSEASEDNLPINPASLSSSNWWSTTLYWAY